MINKAVWIKLKFITLLWSFRVRSYYFKLLLYLLWRFSHNLQLWCCTWSNSRECWLFFNDLLLTCFIMFDHSISMTSTSMVSTWYHKSDLCVVPFQERLVFFVNGGGQVPGNMLIEFRIHCHFDSDGELFVQNVKPLQIWNKVDQITVHQFLTLVSKALPMRQWKDVSSVYFLFNMLCAFTEYHHQLNTS